MEELAPVLGVATFFGVCGWIFRLFLNHRRQTKIVLLQSELQKQLLDKFDSTEELRHFLESDSGRNFIDSTPVEKQSPHGRIMGALQSGLIMTTAGLACLYLRHQIPDGREMFVFLGAIGLALGLGFLLSAGATYFLSRKWGLIDGGVSGAGAGE